MTAAQQRQCIYCQRLVSWQWQGQRLKDGSKIYLDEQGRRWAGRRCPSCEKQRVQTAIRFNRFDRMLLTKELAARGYRVKKFANPIVAEANGKNLLYSCAQSLYRWTCHHHRRTPPPR